MSPDSSGQRLLGNPLYYGFTTFVTDGAMLGEHPVNECDHGHAGQMPDFRPFQARRYSPERPPDFSSRARSVMVIPRSMALHMS